MATLPFPCVEAASVLRDGSRLRASPFCRRSFGSKPECKQHYADLASKPEGYYQCPFGFTSRSVRYGGHLYVLTGVVAFPRFGTPSEQALGKKYPDLRVAREELESICTLLKELDRERADIIQKATEIIPQAFHELRKLNGAVIQHAEREIAEMGERPSLLSIQGAAELMRNNFDILEALSNIESMKALPVDATVNVYDLVFKMKKIYQERAMARKMQVWVDGVRAIVPGSRKSFPIVPAVLLENAIKYGRVGSTIVATVSAEGGQALLCVENLSDHSIDPEDCFNRGTRYAGESAEGGGFGLFLAKEIVLAHNGEIECVVEREKIRISVRLPLKQVIAQK